MFATAVREQQFTFFSYTEEEDVMDALRFQYEVSSESFDEIPIPCAKDLCEGLIELYIDESICRQMEYDNVYFLPSAAEITEIRMKDDDDAWEEITTNAIDMLMGYNLFAHPQYGSDDQHRFVKDILMLLDQHGMTYTIPVDEKSDLTGRAVFYDNYGSFTVHNCPLQEVW